MPVVVDANVVISALIADSRTRELVVTLEPDLLAPEVIRDEIGNHEDAIVEKSGLDHGRVAQVVELLFRHVDVVPGREIHPAIELAREAIGDVDPDDVVYLACAIARDAAIWTDDSDFRRQDLVPVYTTNEVIHAFDAG